MTIKRSFDIAASLTGLAVTGIPVLGIAFTMAAMNGISPFYRQIRVGKDRTPFNIIKIQTMNQKRDAKGNLLGDEERVVPFGKFLRKSRIDELPQLWNVLKGEMSLVGPRPVPFYYGLLGHDKKRHEVQPGLTGTAQIRAKNKLSMEEWAALDHEYVDHHSFWSDIGIIIQTPFSLVKHRDAPHFHDRGQECRNPHNIIV